jgi:hypothetical protein
MENQEQIPATTHNAQPLYSEAAINIATFLGGPIAAGILIRRNFINLGNEDYGKHTIAIAVVSTVLLFAVLLSIPESKTTESFGRFFPFIVTAIVAGILHRFQGEQIKNHENNGGKFYSKWKAAGIGILTMIGMLIGILGFVYADEPDFDTELYDQKVSEFYANEEQAMEMYQILNNDNDVDAAYDFIIDEGIPLWDANLVLLDEMDAIENLTQDFIDQDAILREYVDLRIQSYKLIALSLMSGEFDPAIDDINKKIDATLARL